jgi:putative glutamine amidotransferase
MVRRPRIAITMRLELQTQRFYLGRDYSEAVEASGGVPVLIPLIPKRDYISAALEGVDGVLLPGSNTDIDPHRYGDEPHPMLGTVIPEKDESDIYVLEEADRRQLPLLGICFGMQALNVHRGGSLIQDIHSEVPNSVKHEQGLPSNRVSHSVDIAGDGLLSTLSAVKNAENHLRVNSSHHQAVSRLGDGLRAIAWARDGIIEAVEDTSGERFVLGVQWHPELTAAFDHLSKEIFDVFVAECAKLRQFNKLSAVI